MARDNAFHSTYKDPKTEPKRKAKHRDWSGATLALLIGLGGLVLGRLGTLWIRFDVFSQFAMQFALLCGAAAIGILIPRYKGLVTAVLFVLSVVAYGSWSHLATRGPEAALQAGEKRLRVMQWNVHGKVTQVDEAMATIKALDPDVISLVEMVEEDKPLLEQLKVGWPHQATCWQISGCETAILSRIPITATDSQAYWEGPNYILATLGPDYGGLRILATHTTRFPFANAQFKQVKAMVRLVEGGGPLVALGDFNATPFSRITQTLAESLGFERLTSLPTWNANYGLPQLAIDHIFVSPRIKALDSEKIGEYAGSDHFPITIT